MEPSGRASGGRLLLTASTLTAPYAERFGRDVLFGVAGRKAREGTFALDARLRSDAVTLRAWGEGDLGKRRFGPGGVRLDAQAAALSKIVGAGPKLGAARAAGVVTGDATAWKFTGTADVADVELAGYRLARISGPVEFGRTKVGFAVKAKASGAGGQGDGFAAALLGGQPSPYWKASASPTAKSCCDAWTSRGAGSRCRRAVGVDCWAG